MAYVLLQAGKRYQSITLEADARHLMTDVLTTAGVLVGLGVVTLTRWQILDPLIAIGVAVNIIWSGVGLVRRSVLGLMDTSIPAADQLKVAAILDAHAKNGLQYHDLRTRQAAAQQFISVHVLVPGKWSVQRGHDLLESDRVRDPRGAAAGPGDHAPGAGRGSGCLGEHDPGEPGKTGSMTCIKKKETEARGLGLFCLLTRLQAGKDASAAGRSGYTGILLRKPAILST